MNLNIKKTADKLFALQSKVNAEIKELQNQCPHTTIKFLSSWNDHDGWSIVEVNYYSDYICEDCKKYIQKHNGKVIAHS